MDHNLNESLNLENAMGVEFGHSQEVVGQEDIILDNSGHEDISMEFENIEQQPILLDSGDQEITVSDFMGDQFSLQSYQDDQMVGITTDESNQQNILTDQSGEMINLQYGAPFISMPDLQAPMRKPLVKAGAVEASTSQTQASDSNANTVTAPRQIAIAPKPPKQSILVQKGQKPPQVGKQYALAPKPVALMSNRTVSLVKKVSLAGAMQANAKGKPVLAQIGKQLVVMPASGSQKIKLVTTPTTMRIIGSDQAKVVTSGAGGQVPKQLTKVIVQGTKVKSQPTSEQSGQSVLTKVVSGAGTATPARYVTMHQKTVPISIGNNKIVVSSPVKQGAIKQQFYSIKSPGKLLPAEQTQAVAQKKVVINASSIQNMKTQAKTINLSKVSGQKSLLHRIEVPGKGVQYIRLVTNSSNSNPSGIAKAVTKSPGTASSTPKTFVLTDNKGNVIQMGSDAGSNQPTPVVVNSGSITPKPHQKLVRIAPVASKTGQAFMQARAGKSLLAPMQAAKPPTPPAPQPPPDMPDLDGFQTPPDHDYQGVTESAETDSKAALHALIADTVRGEVDEHTAQGSDAADPQRTKHQTEQPQDTRSPDRSHDSSASHSGEGGEHPLIVIPSFMKQDLNNTAYNAWDDNRLDSSINVEVEYEPFRPRVSSPAAVSDIDMASTELGPRPRKACNCTKSQCLKLYCDCFANGEFCNRCNCHNCHNNLQNEELRQKAIRGCLDRNPYAFRPKIGKTKSGGPQIIRRHNKGCNCKRSGCLKNYCECYEAKIACTSICKCVGCRNVEETVERARRRDDSGGGRGVVLRQQPTVVAKQPCSFMTTEVIEAVCQCLVAAGVEGGADGKGAEGAEADPVGAVLEEFARCLQDIISAAHQAAPLGTLNEAPA